jgi:hypothetical protein
MQALLRAASRSPLFSAGLFQGSPAAPTCRAQLEKQRPRCMRLSPVSHEVGERAEWVHDQCRLEWGAKRFLAEPDERALSETDDGVNTDFAPTEPTAGRSRLQVAGLHSPALEYLEGVRLPNSHLLVLSNQPGCRVIVWRLYPIVTDEGMP